MCHELISVQPYFLLITKRTIFVTVGSLLCYLIWISDVFLSEGTSSHEVIFLSFGQIWVEIVMLYKVPFF